MCNETKAAEAAETTATTTAQPEVMVQEYCPSCGWRADRLKTYDEVYETCPDCREPLKWREE